MPNLIHLPEIKYLISTKTVLFPFEVYEGGKQSLLAITMTANTSKTIEFTGIDGNKYSQLITVRGANA